jgi:hypothetical protein
MSLKLWSAYLTFIDRISNINIIMIYKFLPPFTYTGLYNILDVIFRKKGYKFPDRNLYNITFKLHTWRKEPVKITDLSMFILNHDIIKIILYDSTKLRYGLFRENGDKIMEKHSINLIYDSIRMKYINETILLYSIDGSGEKQKLLDVIINPKQPYNDLVNRMIKRGWY